MEKDRDESLYSRVFSIDQVIDEVGLPDHASTLALLLSMLDTPEICFSTDEKHEIRCRNLFRHPVEPSLSRSGSVLIDHRIHSVVTQAIRESQHPVLMLG